MGYTYGFRKDAARTLWLAEGRQIGSTEPWPDMSKWPEG